MFTARGETGMEDVVAEFKEKLYKIEAESGIFELEVNKIRLWQYMRWFCLVEILYDVTGREERTHIRRTVKAQREKMSIRERISRWQFLIGKKDLVVINHCRRVKEGKYYRCFVTETMLENLDCSYYVFEEDYFGRHFRPVTTKNLKYIDMNWIRKYFNRKNDSTNREIKKFFDRIIQVFEKEYGIPLSQNVKKVMHDYIFHKYYEIHYRTIWAKIVFSLVKPKAFMVTSPYTPDLEAIIVEAKRRNIKTIELQHGIDHTHIAYNYLYQGKIDVFCDYIFVYGKYDKEVPRYPIPRDHVIAVGYPDLERKVEIYKKRKRDKKKTLVFISGDRTASILPDYAVALRKRDELKEFRMIYKLHPDEYAAWKSIYPQLCNSGLEIIDNNNKDIYYYLGLADYVIGITSSSLYQATAFDAEIFIVKGGQYQISDILYKNGYAHLVTSEDMIVDKIINSVEGKGASKSYFEKNAIENIKRELNKIMKESGNGI